MVSNKSSGTAFERELAERLSRQGFWVHRLQDNKNGQPADLIAASNGSTYLIDCKRCEADVFRFSRIEPNQHTAMRLWHDTGNGWGLFAVMIENRIFMVSYWMIMEWVREGWKQAGRKELEISGMELSDWMKMHMADREGGENDWSS